MNFSLPITEFQANPAWTTPAKAFRGPRGAVREAKYLDYNPFGGRSRCRTDSQKAGKRYEKKVLRSLAKIWPGDFRPSPWISYSDSRATPHFCQPDGLFIDEWKVFIFEIKLSHTVSAFWQLKHLYLPVVQALYPTRAIALCEITRSFDPAVLFPEPFSLFFDPAQYLSTPCALGVLQWKP